MAEKPVGLLPDYKEQFGKYSLEHQNGAQFAIFP